MNQASTRVFLIEDSSDDEYFIRRAISRLFPSLSIEFAADGEEAIRMLFDETHPPPALILVDVRLPKLSGHEVLEQLRASKRFVHTPIVMLTSSNERADIERAYELGANGYVQKAVEFDDYVDRFATMLHYWLRINSS
ncbi:response regulator [soil metagenome]